ncbi:MAG: exonuclease SbcCD subunit D [Clostridia bacterium]|nr:exonuclease SbcCD subunit D [Clostridia bacterium]
MKFVHISDLHLGKRLQDRSLLEDQKYILDEIVKILDEERPDGLLIAGDIYDKSLPSAEAAMLFDSFLTSLAKRKQETFIISGNHDSAERLSFANRIIDLAGIHISSVFSGKMEKYEMEDVNVYLLPYIKPIHVKRFMPDAEIETYTQALQAVIDGEDIPKDKKNILVTHQFVTGASRSDSETISVGGTDNVDASVFAPFDYVALGHIHGPQDMVKGKVRYSGTPLKYSFSEADHEKSVTVIEISDHVEIRTIPLKPMVDLRRIRGTFEEVMLSSSEDYVEITLLDEDSIPNAMAKLSQNYPRVISIRYDNTRTRERQQVSRADIKESPMEQFAKLYQLQNNQPLTDKQEEIVKEIMEKVWEGSYEG